MMLEMCGSDGLKVVINGTRLGLLTSLVCKASLRGTSAARRICLVTTLPVTTAVASFKEVSGKLSSASIKRGVGRTDTSYAEC